MPHYSHVRMFAALAVAMIAVVSRLAANDRSYERSYNFPASTVWTAATAVAQESFFLESSSQENATLRFRVVTMWGHRFRAEVISVRPNRTRVVVRVRVNAHVLEKRARGS